MSFFSGGKLKPGGPFAKLFSQIQGQKPKDGPPVDALRPGIAPLPGAVLKAKKKLRKTPSSGSVATRIGEKVGLGVAGDPKSGAERTAKRLLGN